MHLVGLIKNKFTLCLNISLTADPADAEPVL